MGYYLWTLVLLHQRLDNGGVDDESQDQGQQPESPESLVCHYAKHLDEGTHVDDVLIVACYARHGDVCPSVQNFSIMPQQGLCSRMTSVTKGLVPQSFQFKDSDFNGRRREIGAVLSHISMKEGTSTLVLY